MEPWNPEHCIAPVDAPPADDALEAHVVEEQERDAEDNECRACGGSGGGLPPAICPSCSGTGYRRGRAPRNPNHFINHEDF